MKFITAFSDFLKDEVNLNKSRIETLESKVETITGFISNSDWAPKILRSQPQGSWAHKTIIKPPSDKSFDADLVFFIEPVEEWEAIDYLAELRAIFTASDLYKDKVTLKTRCVRLEYATDFHLDLVPCIVNRLGYQSYEVCNRRDAIFEHTDSDAYNDWWQEKCAWVGGDSLREVTRLLKYLRDIKSTFSCKSILLTTLIGSRMGYVDSINHTTLFPDTPTALKTLMGRLDDYLQLNPVMPVITNPVLLSEELVRHWDQDKYSNFRNQINKYRGWVDEAYLEADHDQSVSKWKRVFGEKFGKGLIKEESAVLKNALIGSNDTRIADAVAAVQFYGPSILAKARRAFVWMQPTRWKMVIPEKMVHVSIQATLHTAKNGEPIKRFFSAETIPKSKGILFEALDKNSQKFDGSNYKVWWQVSNSDREAYRGNALRGGFYQPDGASKRWEETAYRGVHIVEAFVVRKTDRMCIGKSASFHVVVE